MDPKANDSGDPAAVANDTSPEAASMQARVHRKLDGAQRFRIALDMSLTARAFTLARLRRAHSDWSERELLLEVVRIAFLPGEPPFSSR